MMKYFLGPILYKRFKEAGVPEEMLVLTKPLPIDETQSIWKNLAASDHVSDTL